MKQKNSFCTYTNLRSEFNFRQERWEFFSLHAQNGFKAYTASYTGANLCIG
jgi:hypothetical protein